jgi:formylglycine-generating enzyme required for sulfatase activity
MRACRVGGWLLLASLAGAGCRKDDCAGAPAQAQIDVQLSGIAASDVSGVDVTLAVNGGKPVTHAFSTATSFTIGLKDQTPGPLSIKAVVYKASKVIGTGEASVTFTADACNFFTVTVKPGGAVDGGPDGPRPDVGPGDGPKPEAGKADAKPDGPKTDGPKPDLMKPDVEKPDALKPDAPVIKCGDGVISMGEVCDGAVLGGKTCQTQGFYAGTLACASDCKSFDTSGCTNCGNGTIETATGEECDGTNLGGKGCSTVGCISGTLGCTSSCKFDKTQCQLCTCGNGTIESGEQCDGANLNGKSCTTQGFDGGTLTCKGDCIFNTSACYKCGDGIINGPTEVCDGTALGVNTCVTQGFDGGTLKCAAGCKSLDTSGCYKCGDGILNGNEQCDKLQLGGKTCATQGFDGGALACKAGCTFDTSACYKCGDGVKNGPTEQCDGSDLAGKTCPSLGFGGGTLKCTGSCTLWLSQCTTTGYAQIAAGTFIMGSATTEPCRNTDEDQHPVTLTHGFEMKITEVTQAEFQAAMGYNPSGGTSCGGGCPVEMVDWYEAAAYCNKLSSDKGLAQCYACTGSGASVTCSGSSTYTGANIYGCPGYRLPTEAEWEYAYRAGTTTAFYNGANDPTKCNTCSDARAGTIAWYGCNAGGTSHPSGQKQANAWGLYDMAGNVWEWCNDNYTASLGTSAVIDPWGAASGGPVFRGGSWSGAPQVLRAATRLLNFPTYRLSYLGFRCVRTLLP